jgi:hypothetical protein
VAAKKEPSRGKTKTARAAKPKRARAAEPIVESSAPPATDEAIAATPPAAEGTA